MNCSTRAGWRCSPITRAPTSAVSSPVTRLAGLSQGRSRITERSPVTGFSQTSPTFMGLRSGAPFGSGCDIESRIGDLWSATLPQSDKGRVARHPPAIPRYCPALASENWFVQTTALFLICRLTCGLIENSAGVRTCRSRRAEYEKVSAVRLNVCLHGSGQPLPCSRRRR